jgi:hypothetical protein
MKQISEKKVEQLQGMTDAYIGKKGLSGKMNVKIIAAFLALTGGAMTLLTSCGVVRQDGGSSFPGKDVEESVLLKDGLDRGGYKYQFADPLADNEIIVEKELAQYLSEQTGLKVEVIDMRDVKLVRSSGNYLVISGNMITDVKKGIEKCSVTLKLSDEQMAKLEAAMERRVWENGNAEYATTPYRDDLVSLNYTEDFCDAVRAVVRDSETEISAIYNKDSGEWLFDADEESVASEKQNESKNKR